VVVASEPERLSSDCRPLARGAPRALVVALLGAVLLGAALLSACSARTAPSAAPDMEAVAAVAVVERVVDGDTVILVIDEQTESVRLIGIDTPESVSRNVPDQCFGAEASAALSQLLPAGSEVHISRDLEARDRYGRLLLYLHRADDGLFINHWMVTEGYAASISYEPNTAHRSLLARAEHNASTAGIGLWGQCDGPDQPLDPD